MAPKITKNGVFPAGSLAPTLLNYPGTANPRLVAAHVQPHADALATAFMLEFGRPLEATDGERDRKEQERLYALYLAGKGAPAAIPGESNHGWGTAIDFASNINNFSSAEHRWMRANAGKFGFTHPYWARQGGGREEPWHWEYTGGGASSPRIRRAKKGEVGIGDSGEKVEHIQTLLNQRLSGPNMKVDGRFGLMTALAAYKYQKSVGFAGVGAVGPVTLRSLEGKDVTPTKPPKPAPPVKPSGPVIYLKPGTGNTEGTKALQGFLRNAFPTQFGKGKEHEVIVDGDYGPATEYAVKFWQHKAGLARTGTIGSKSRARLVELGVFK